MFMKKFSEMKFKKPDLKKIESDFNAIITEFTGATCFEEQDKALQKMFKYSDKIATNFNIAYTKYTCDTQDPVNVKNQELLEKINEIAKEINPTYCCVVTFDHDFTGE